MDKSDVWQGTLALMVLKKFYKLTRAGRKQAEIEATEWEKTTGIPARFLRIGEARS